MDLGLDPVSKATAEEKRLRCKDAIKGLFFVCVKTNENTVELQSLVLVGGLGGVWWVVGKSAEVEATFGLA